MKFFNNPVKIFLGVLVFTLISSAIAPYAFHKAIENDPDLEKKIADKFGVKIDLSSSGFYVSETNGGEKKILQNWSLQNKNQKIILNLKRGDIYVTSGEGDNILIEAKASRRTGSEFLTMTESPESIILTDTEKVNSVDVHITVPKSYKGKLDLSSIKGDIEVKKVAAEALQFNAVSADVSVHDTSIPFIHGVNINGDIRIESEVPLSAEISNIRGDVKIATADRTNTLFTLKSTRGDIENPLSSSQNPKYRIDVSTVNGDITIE